MEKINIADILDKCPRHTKLYSPIFGDVYLDKIRPHLAIVVTTAGNSKEEFLYDGRYSIDGECMLFPSKDQRDWSKFQRPFKDGDIVMSSLGNIHILKNSTTSYCYFNRLGILEKTETTYIKVKRLATEEEKQRLFKAIKDNGYKWNAETKTLEKLVEPKFKIGDRIRHKGDETVITITGVGDDYYFILFFNTRREDYQNEKVLFEDQDNYELVSNKFDINTLKPFESRVLVRTRQFHDTWTAGFFSHKDSDGFAPFWTTADKRYQQCIPYKNNEHLLGTTNDCDDYYKTW